MAESADVVVIGAGHNGLACGAYLARAGFDVVVLEAAPRPGGCCATEELPGGAGRVERGSYEHGAIRGSGVAADLELETRFGLAFHERDEATLGPCDDGSAIALYASLQQTVEGLEPVVGAEEAERYRLLAARATAAMTLLRATEAGPPPTLRALAALSEVTLGATAGGALMGDLLGSASTLLRAALTDPRLQGVIAHWAAHSQQSPADPGTGAGAFFLPGSHGPPASRPVGGASATIDALQSSLEAAGGRLRCATPAERIELDGDGCAVAVHAGGERIAARRAVVSAIDARRALLELVGEDHLPARLADEVRAIHVGARNVSELKVDATITTLPDVPGPPGFERSFMLSPNTLTDTEHAFARIELGELPQRGPLMLGLPSTLEPGWARPGQHAIWLSTFVPWRRADGPWTPREPRRSRRPRVVLGRARPGRADRGRRARGHRPRRLGGTHRQPGRLPQPRRHEHRPAAGQPALAVARGLPHAAGRPLPQWRRHASRRWRQRHPRPQHRGRRAR